MRLNTICTKLNMKTLPSFFEAKQEKEVAIVQNLTTAEAYTKQRPLLSRMLYYEETDRREYLLYEWTLEATQIVLADDGIVEFKDITPKKIATEVKYISSREVYRFFRRVDINKGDKLFKQSLRDQEVLLNRKKDKVSKCRRSQNQFVELIYFYDAIRNKARKSYRNTVL